MERPYYTLKSPNVKYKEGGCKNVQNLSIFFITLDAEKLRTIIPHMVKMLLKRLVETETSDA